MAKRWRKNPKLTGLAAVCEGPRHSSLWDGDLELATISYINGRWHDVKGWYFVCMLNEELGIGHNNTCNEPVETEKEAKVQAVSYIKECIRNKLINKEYNNKSVNRLLSK